MFSLKILFLVRFSPQRKFSPQFPLIDFSCDFATYNLLREQGAQFIFSLYFTPLQSYPQVVLNRICFSVFFTPQLFSCRSVVPNRFMSSDFSTYFSPQISFARNTFSSQFGYSVSNRFFSPIFLLQALSPRDAEPLDTC